MTAENLSVIVIDDDQDVRLVMKLAFEVDGRFDVIALGESADDAVALTAAHQPDAIVLDVRMPDVDGLTVLPSIRREAPDAKVMLFSVLDEELMGPELQAAGADDYLPKGTSPAEIIDRLADLCVDRGDVDGQSA
ncbi:MAG: response regulator transcription factor [Actinomycetota bacterium]|nr:response regulator transcription factor [Actinomycetota bacterium]